MNERSRFGDNGIPPDTRAPAQNSYYFPPSSYPRGAQAPAQSHPQPQPFHQQYQEPAYRQPDYQQPGYPPAGYQQPLPPQPRYQPPQYAQPEPAAFATIDDAVAQISARQRALDGDPRSAMPPQPPMPPANHGYGPETYAPPQYRAPAYAPPLSPYGAPAYAETPRYAPPPAPARTCRALKRICAISPPRSRPFASRRPISQACSVNCAAISAKSALA